MASLGFSFINGDHNDARMPSNFQDSEEILAVEDYEWYPIISVPGRVV